jgi:hypothetical protein
MQNSNEDRLKGILLLLSQRLDWVGNMTRDGQSTHLTLKAPPHAVMRTTAAPRVREFDFSAIGVPILCADQVIGAST